MLTFGHAHATLRSPTFARSRTIERAAPIPFPANDDDLYNLMPAERARRFADLRASLREAKRATARRSEIEPDSLTPAAARLQAATRYYEQHVLAWYALGRVSEARAARQAITRCREGLSAERPTQREQPGRSPTIVTRRHPVDRQRL